MEDWKQELEEILEDETDTGRNMIPKYARCYARIILENFISQEIEKAREEGRREVYEAIVFDKNIPHDITTFVAANLWKNMRDKAKEELSKLKDNK